MGQLVGLLVGLLGAVGDGTILLTTYFLLTMIIFYDILLLMI